MAPLEKNIEENIKINVKHTLSNNGRQLTPFYGQR